MILYNHPKECQRYVLCFEIYLDTILSTIASTNGLSVLRPFLCQQDMPVFQLIMCNKSGMIMKKLLHYNQRNAKIQTKKKPTKNK